MTEYTDQPMPIEAPPPDMQTLVIGDLHERHVLGIERYGIGVRVGNGRDMVRDAYEEILDLAVYTRGIVEIREKLIHVLTHIADLHCLNDRCCDVCGTSYPCHTRVDMTSALRLLGVDKIY